MSLYFSVAYLVKTVILIIQRHNTVGNYRYIYASNTSTHRQLYIRQNTAPKTHDSPEYTRLDTGLQPTPSMFERQ